MGLKEWAKRDEGSNRVMHAIVGMYGDLQEISEKRLQEIGGLNLPLFEADDEKPNRSIDEDQ